MAVVEIIFIALVAVIALATLTMLVFLLNGLACVGMPLKADREQAWRDFAGWRVNYDAVLVALAVLTAAPEAPWSSDRAPRQLSALTSPLRRSRAVAAAIASGSRQTDAHARRRQGVMARMKRV